MVNKDRGQPTPLKELDRLINERRDEEAEQIDNFPEDRKEIETCDNALTTRWLEWTYNFLSARRLYHKHRAIKQAMLQRMAETLLSKDELEAIDREAERQLGEEPLANLEDEPAQLALSTNDPFDKHNRDDEDPT